MSKTLDIIMQLKDNVSPNLGKMNSNLQTTSGKLNAVGKSVGKLGSLLKGAFVGGAIAKFTMDAMKAYDVQVQSEKAVQRALVATGKTSAEASQQLERYKKFASQQQDITAFGDEGTLKVISGLISQGFGEDAIKNLVPMCQDIARSTGDEQENVTKALSAYVKTGKGATKLAKAYKLNADLLGKGKTESERMAEVWKAFSQSDHLGASTEYMKTFTGQLEGAKGKLADLTEPIGQIAFQILGVGENGKQLQDIIGDITGDLQGIADKSKELGGGITGVAIATAEAHPILAGFFALITGGKVITAIASLTESFGTARIALTALGGVLSSTGALIASITFLATEASLAIADLLGNIGGYFQASPELKASLQKDQELANGVQQSIPSMYEYHPSIFDNNANGTNYFKGGTTLVGEYGPELVNLPRGASINTNAQTQRELSGSGTTINCPVTIQGNVIGNNDFIDQIGDAISSRVGLAIANM